MTAIDVRDTKRAAGRNRSPLRLMLDRTVGAFMLAKTFSACGTWAEQVAAAVLMWELTHSAVLVGAVSAVQFAWPFVLALWAGALTDRVDRRGMLAVSRLISGLPTAALGLALLLLGVDGFGGRSILFLTVAVSGIGHALGSPAMQALVHDLVPERDLESVLALNSVSPSIARALGPMLAAGLLLLGNPGYAFAAAGASHLTFAAVLLLIRVSRSVSPAGRPRLLGGLRYLADHRAIMLLLVAVVVIGYGSDPVLTLSPKLADELGDDQFVGLFVSAFGAGALLTTVTFSWLRRRLSLRWSTVVGLWVLGVGLAVAGVLGSRWGVVAGFAVAGTGFMLALVSANVRVQQQLPDDVRGRVLAIWSLAFLGARPLSAPVNGAVADHTTVRVALVVAALVVVVGSALAAVKEAPTVPKGSPAQAVVR